MEEDAEGTMARQQVTKLIGMVKIVPDISKTRGEEAFHHLMIAIKRVSLSHKEVDSMESALNIEIETVEGMIHSTGAVEVPVLVAAAEAVEGRITTQEVGGWKSAAPHSMMGPTSSQRKKS